MGIGGIGGSGGYVGGPQYENTPSDPKETEKANDQTSFLMIYNWLVKTYGPGEGGRRFQEFMEPIKKGEETLMSAMKKMHSKENDPTKQTQMETIMDNYSKENDQQ